MTNLKAINIKTDTDPIWMSLPDDSGAGDYQSYHLSNFRGIPQIARLTEEERFSIEVVGRVFPFKVNNYVLDELIDWEHAPEDPIYKLTFPRREMLFEEHYRRIAGLLESGADKKKLQQSADRIRWSLNPHPGGQTEKNMPSFDGEKLPGMQHKYRETVLFFPAHGQTCHAYCSFCFRWPQFAGMKGMKIAMSETDRLIGYLEKHPEVTDLIFTGGDPLVMKSDKLAMYVNALLEADIRSLKTIRIGTKALAFWPYRFLTDPDAGHLLKLFRTIVNSGKYLAIMANFNHPRELETSAVKEAISRILETGAQIRTQSPLIAGINDNAETWTEMWSAQVKLGCIPYYMFMARDTGAQHCLSVPLERAYTIFRDAYSRIGGLARTVRGPVMSAYPGKVQMLGVTEISGEKIFMLQFLQGRNPDWVKRPFFAACDESAVWFEELRPAFGEKRFFFGPEN